MKKHYNNGLIHFTFDSFDKAKLKHCFSSRVGGVSKAHQASLSFSVKNEGRENVVENFSRLCNATKIDIQNLVLSDQVHSNNIKYVDSSYKNSLFEKKDITEIDCLVTDEKDVCLVTFFADCVPLFFYDKEKKVIANAHSGWRGTYNQIGKDVINFMINNFDSKPENIICAIGPSIGSCCYEVDEDLYKKFLVYDEQSCNILDGRYYIDLQIYNKKILMDNGVRNIEVAGLCTKCNNDLFYSHRISPLRGLMVGMLQL